MKFLAESKEYGLKSISPEKIISSTMLVVFNEKYRTLTVYHAKDPRGLGVKGTTITNYDEEKSVTKKLRKPKEVLAKLSGVRAVTNAIAAIKTKPAKMTGRINENTVLVGAY
jgi:Pyruvate/2-oxoacid:ferredoxin oxidoreductase gamma subunit